MEKFIEQPSLDMYTGIVVHKDTTLNYTNENVEQTLMDLVFHSITKVKGDNFESIYDTTITLNDGDVLIFEEDKRGYIVPVNKFVKVEDAINELKCIKE